MKTTTALLALRPITAAGLATLLLLLAPYAAAQPRKTPHTYTLAEGASPPPASIADVAWIAGHWRGDGFGGVTEEVWAPPLGGTMMGMFKLVHGERISVYELLTLSELEGSLVLRLKHFHADMTAWEEKEEVRTFRLVAIDPGTAAHFDGLSFERLSDDCIQIWLAIERDGKMHEEGFHYRRYGSSQAVEKPPAP